MSCERLATQKAGGPLCSKREVRYARSERFARCHAGGSRRRKREVRCARSERFTLNRANTSLLAASTTHMLDLGRSISHYHFPTWAFTRPKKRTRVAITLNRECGSRFFADRARKRDLARMSKRTPPLPLCARQNSFSGSPTTRSALRREARGETSCGARRRLRSCFGSETPSSRRSGEPLSPARRRRRAVVWSMRSSEFPDPGTHSRVRRHGAGCVPPHEALRHGSPRTLFSRDTRTACPPQHTERFGCPPREPTTDRVDPSVKPRRQLDGAIETRTRQTETSDARRRA